MSDPVTFFFVQNDVEGSAAAFFLEGHMQGPYTLSASREEAAELGRSYEFRKERGLLASLDVK